jgi:hypothetical protein
MVFAPVWFYMQVLHERACAVFSHMCGSLAYRHLLFRGTTLQIDRAFADMPYFRCLVVLVLPTTLK